MLSSGLLEIRQVDRGLSPGVKAGDADLDYEIVDRAGECAPPGPLQPSPRPWAGLAAQEEEGEPGSPGRLGRQASASPEAGLRKRASLLPCPGPLGNPKYLVIQAHALFSGRPFCLSPGSQGSCAHLPIPLSNKGSDSSGHTFLLSVPLSLSPSLLWSGDTRVSQRHQKAAGFRTPTPTPEEAPVGSISPPSGGT